MPRAQGCAGAAPLRLARCLGMNGMPRAQGCAGAAPLRLERCLGMNGMPRAQGDVRATQHIFVLCVSDFDFKGGGLWFCT